MKDLRQIEFVKCDVKGLCVSTRMDKSANTIGEEYVDFLRFNNCRNFSGSPHWMDHYLACSVGARHVVRFALN